MFTVYSTPGCSYCDAAKQLLTQKGLDFEVIDLMEDPEAMQVMASIQARTVPQIFHEGVHIGGYTNLKEYLEEDDEG
jgi:glutaredoxin